MSFGQKNNKLMDDISENLKQTMKKISDLDTENDLLNDEEDNNNYNNFKGSKLNISRRTFLSQPQNVQENNAFNKTSNYKNSAQNFNVTNESLYSNRLNNNKKSNNNFNNTSMNNYENNNNNNNIKNYSDNIIKGLDQLYNDINKDFDEIEDFIKTSIQQ